MSRPPNDRPGPAERSLLALDQVRSVFGLFVVLTPLLLLILAPTAWHSNEEDYFQLAYQQVAPEAFHQYDSIFDASKARIAAEIVIGTAVEWLGYENAHVALRIALTVLYSLGLALFFSALRVGAIAAALVVTVFCAMGEQLIGGEWLFRGVEPKTFAYAFLFIAFAMAYRRQWTAAFVFAAVSTYFHFLVGGFWTLMLMGMQRSEVKSLTPVMRHAALFFVLVIPLMIVVVPHDVASLFVAAPEQGPSVDYIYAELRGAEHMGPFKSRWAFWTWLPGFVVTLGLIGVLIGLRRRGMLPQIGTVALVALVYLLLAVVVAFFDRHTNYMGKFYLFRPSSLTLFFALTAIVLSLWRESSDAARWPLILVASAYIGVFVWNVGQAQVDIVRSTPAVPYERELISAIEKYSAADDVVLLEPFNEMQAQYARLHRVIPRPTLVSWKFTPTFPTDILRWYDLIQRRERYFAAGCAEPMQPKVKLLVVFQREVAERMRGCGDRLWEHGDTVLIGVRENAASPSH